MSHPTHRRTLSGQLVPWDFRPCWWTDIVRPPAPAEPRQRNTPHDVAMREIPNPASLRYHVVNDAEHYDASTPVGTTVEFYGPNRAALRAAGMYKGHRKPSLSARRTT
jgi:hypothetical protein